METRYRLQNEAGEYLQSAPNQPKAITWGPVETARTFDTFKLASTKRMFIEPRVNEDVEVVAIEVK